MRILVTGAGGFIGGHLCKRLEAEGHYVEGVDIKSPEDWWQRHGTTIYCTDLRQMKNVDPVCQGFDRIFHLAADMGGMGYTSVYHADIILNNTLIDSNMIWAAKWYGVKRFLYTSSACVYPMYLTCSQEASQPPSLKETDVYPANPQTAYDWQKLHTEHICKYVGEASWLNMRVARLHNCYGPHGEWHGGREKAPAALCRKVAVAKLTGQKSIEVWGDGLAVRSYMYVDDCVEGLIRLMESDYSGPLNIGRSEAISVDELARLIADIAGVNVDLIHVPGPQGVRSRNSDNTLCLRELEWEPGTAIKEGLRKTHHWIEKEVEAVLKQGREL